MGKIKDLVGRRFGQLVVVSKSTERSPAGRIKWDCLCDCGATKTVIGNDLVTGKSTSCGCARSRNSHTGLYKTFNSMKKRCNSSKKVFNNYKNRGIKVCDRWMAPGKQGFLNFKEDMGAGYSSGLELDRKDNDEGYSKDNCRWVTKEQNNLNRGGRLKATSKFKGVSWSTKLSLWVAQITLKGVHRYIGAFNNEIDAAIAYNKSAYELFGEFAYLNKIVPIQG